MAGVAFIYMFSSAAPYSGVPSGTGFVVSKGIPAGGGGAMLTYLGPHNGAVTWSVTSGALPTGVTLASAATNSIDGQLSGTPTTAGTFTATIQATSGATTASATIEFVVTATPDAAVLVRYEVSGFSTYFAAVAGQSFWIPLLFELNHAGGAIAPPVTWSAIDALPAGVTLTSEAPFTGSNISAVLSGTAAAGTYNFRLNATNGSENETSMMSLTVTADQQIGMMLPPATVGSAYSFTLDSAYGDSLFASFGKSPAGPYSFTEISAPAGLSLSSAGVISGTPTSPDLGIVEFHITGGATTETAQIPIVVLPMPAETGQPIVGTFVGCFSAAGAGCVGGGTV